MTNNKRLLYYAIMGSEATQPVNCPQCHAKCRRFGRHRNGLRRFRCLGCGRTCTEPHAKPLGTMTVPMEKALLALQLLVEGASIRSTERISGLHRDTILRLLLLAGGKCQRVMDEKIHGVHCRLVQADEIWCFVRKKQKRLKPHDPAEWGDAYVFVALDAETKLVPCFRVGKRDGQTAFEFIQDLKERVTGRIQLTTDAFRPYINAVEDNFGADIDYAQLLKVYGDNLDPDQEGSSPSKMISTNTVLQGNPAWDLICTSHVERQNLTMRMSMRRFTRLTNGFSKKLRNLKAAVALHFAYHNFCRVHRSLRVTPAMEAGITDHVWTLEKLISAAR